MSRALWVAGVSCTVGYVLALGLAGRYVRSKVTDSNQQARAESVRVRTVGDREWVEFDGTGFVAHPGRLSMRAISGGDLLILSPPEESDGRIRRIIEKGDPTRLREDQKGQLSGHLGENPADFGLEFTSVTVGDQSVWEIPGDLATPSDVWVIHVHGLGSQRSQVLRGVPTFASMGFTSLVPTYRTSLDGGAQAPPASHLGLSEWRDIEPVQRYALSSGAKRIIYVGWSLGASIVLQVIRNAPASEVAGAVLVSPALDWRSIILAALASAGAPRPLAWWMLSGFNLFRAKGEPVIRWRDLPATSPATDTKVPTMVIHGSADRSTPVDLSRIHAARQPEHITMVESPEAHHTLEWNASPGKWNEAVKAWCITITGHSYAVMACFVS
ncbi:UNVERIFIED_ORG: pimeloyl-ACP methyl ester carboxylesterase [Arthrobacter sp. UYCu721]